MVLTYPITRYPLSAKDLVFSFHDMRFFMYLCSMIWPETFEKKVGFDTVRRTVGNECSSPLGRERLESDLCFQTDFDEIKTRLEQTSEMASILGAPENEFSLGTIHDLRAELSRLRIASTWMPEEELLKFKDNLSAIGEVRAFFSSEYAEDENTYPRLSEIATRLIPHPDLLKEIDRILDRFGEVKDSASPELAQIRSSMKSAAASISATMRRVISGGVSEGWLEADTQASVRDGRLVIPVSPQHKRKIRGITHDESASGKTYYIEPEAVVEANNRLRELTLEERREITRILQGVADMIRPHIDSIIGHEGLETLGLFDFIRAKAKYALGAGGMMPALHDGPELEWYHARHPSLEHSLKRQGKEIVPLDITLTSPERRILVISGPNAGGKSVALKTVAIVQYMTQCGLLPTLHDNSHVGTFESIFLDIGDDQSIEDDLSTYSSHLRNMKTFLARGNNRSLMLVDEFGGGTEPQIGAAIAQALLRSFNNKGMWGIVTTHFQNLKKFAEETPGLVNGSMLYDRHLMQPTFRLAIGQPGSSFALEIARKTGLPEDILAEAKEIVGSDYVNLDKYLLDIARDRRYWENKRRDIHAKEKRLDSVVEKYSDDAEALRAQRRAILAEAKEEAKKIIEGSNAAIERTIREIREAQAEKSRTAEARKKLKEQAENIISDISDNEPKALAKAARKAPRRSIPKAASPTANEELKPGDNVLLDNSSSVGTISEINGKEAIVIFGSLKTTVKLSRLEKTIRKPTSSSTRRPGEGPSSASTSEMSRQRQLNFKHEIDVRGMRVDEAVQAVMYFIDDAIQFNAGRVRILHGTGTGALRQYIRSYLGSVDAVRSFHDEDVRFGGAGITVVEFE